MDSSSSTTKTTVSTMNRRLMALAQQLSPYRQSSSSSYNNNEMEDQRIQESEGKLVSQQGFQQSVAPISKDGFRPKRAAVLICLFEADAGDLRVILTTRSKNLSSHSGEVSLPGGKVDESDKDDIETATREAKEEIGLDPSLVEVVAVLQPFLSKHLINVVPVIGIIKNREAFKPTPNPGEVDEVFDAPLEMFLKEENRTAVVEEDWNVEEKYLLHIFQYKSNNKKYRIWGLTANILVRAASVVYQRPPDFLEQNPNFKFPSVVDKDTVIPRIVKKV